jgi:hypothetical protein
VSRVRIVGGGLTGILAALEAHRLGARDIVLHERFDQIGGIALPRLSGGQELREGCIYFGPRGDAMRTLLEGHGLAFDDFDNLFGSVSNAPGGDLTFVREFGGPAMRTRGLDLKPMVGEALTDRIRAYPEDIAEPLARYCQWHLGTWLDEVHESAVVPMAVNRIYPLGPDAAQVVARKQADPLYDELYAIPRAMWGWTNNLKSSLPRGGFMPFFAQCRRVLEGLGVEVRDTSLVPPRAALAEHAPGDVLVWAANPMPLFKAVGLEAPKLIKKSFATYVFKARFGGPAPFYAQNFTAQGAIFRVYLYESRGQTLALAECVREAGEDELRREIARLMSGFGGETLTLGEMIGANVGPRWIYNSLDAVRRLAQLRAATARRMGASFVGGAWEAYAKGEKFAQVNAGLAAALDTPSAAVTAA